MKIILDVSKVINLTSLRALYWTGDIPALCKLHVAGCLSISQIGGGEKVKVKKVLMIVSALLVLSVIKPAMASATKIPVEGSITAIMTVLGERRITEWNIIIRRHTEEGAPV